MGLMIKPDLHRLAQILLRQDPPAFGRDYVPSILANGEEAPSPSGASPVWSATLGRDVHALSGPEFRVLGIVLYCPWLFDLQEQRLLHFDERPHPLQGHPLASRMELPSLRGALQVAESLGVLNYYPTFWAESGGNRVKMPIVLIGDLLLFLTDAQGPYCVNLDIKATSDAFHKPFPKGRKIGDLTRAREKEEARHLIEKVRYLDGAIKTIEVAADKDVDRHVAANMRQLILWQKRISGLTPECRLEVLDNFQAALEQGVAPLEAMYRMLNRRVGAEAHQLKIELYQAIWSRQIRVDLFQPILIDKPLRPERMDVLEKHKAWFSRG